MTSEKNAWETLKNKYLSKVEKALSSVKHPHIDEVLEDVKSHLEQKFAALENDAQNCRNMEDIIAEMGPASEYAELLGQPIKRKPFPKWLKYAVAIDTVVVVVVLAIVFALTRGPKVGYIISFESNTQYQNITAEELLNELNKASPNTVVTHHYRTQIRGSRLVGLIVVDTEEDKASIFNALTQSENLAPLNIKAVSQKQLEKYYQMGQPSLKTGTRSDSAIASKPVVTETSPVAFANNISADITEITVTFDQPMMNLSWSWVGGGKTFPKTTGEPLYDKSKTICTLPVKLEPGKVYWVGINSPRFKNFQTKMAAAAVPYVILFATEDEDGNPTAIPENYLEEAREINSAK